MPAGWKLGRGGTGTRACVKCWKDAAAGAAIAGGSTGALRHACDSWRASKATAPAGIPLTPQHGCHAATAT
eukprot:333811-Chlamydomonas_euryale.AAC.1